MHIEINDPVHCTIINQAAGHAPQPPAAGKSRLCKQCGKHTWSHTASCMWCGYDRWTPLKRLSSAGTALALGVLIAQLALLH